MTKRTAAWWPAGATDQCSFCLQGYVYELEYRCAHCDRPMCPLCASREPGERERAAVLCPACRRDGGDDDEGG